MDAGKSRGPVDDDGEERKEEAEVDGVEAEEEDEEMTDAAGAVEEHVEGGGGGKQGGRRQRLMARLRQKGGGYLRAADDPLDDATDGNSRRAQPDGGEAEEQTKEADSSHASASTSASTQPPTPSTLPLPLSPSPPSLLQTASAVVIAGAGFMCDAYDLFIMNVVLVVLGCDFSFSSCALSAGDKGALASAVLVGSIAGQLTFGVLADVVGRRRGFILTLSILIVGAVLSSLAQPLGSLSLFTVLALARFVLGVGVGGEYPLSATVSSEASNATAGRGRRVALVFSMQGVGLVLAPVVVLVLLALSVRREAARRTQAQRSGAQCSQRSSSPDALSASLSCVRLCCACVRSLRTARCGACRWVWVRCPGW